MGGARLRSGAGARDKDGAWDRGGRGRGLAFRRVHLHSLGLISRLVAELDEGHQHGQAQPPDQDVEDPSHVTEAQGL